MSKPLKALNSASDSNEAAIARVAAELRSWGGVAVMGAGSSYLAGMPLVSELSALVWLALDSDPEALAELAKKLRQPLSSAKNLIGDDKGRLAHAYEAIRQHPRARTSFQQGFVQRNSERVSISSGSHEGLARLFHEGYIELVVSLNWDTLFEAAYQRVYGRALTADDQLLHKPHGDARHPERDWVLPDESGRIPDMLRNRLTGFADEKPRLLLIVGYSESDEEIVGKLIDPLSRRWRVARIGPAATGELSIRLPADVALPALVAAVTPVPVQNCWRPVNFNLQHDLGPALNGEGLGPQDIEALASLPETSAVISAVRATFRAVISGLSGCGKSGTAYRVARLFNQEGWEVVRLSEPGSDVNALTGPLEGLRFPTLAIIDDAHRMAPALLQEVTNRANSRLAMLAVVTSEQATMREEIRIDPQGAVRIIADKLQRDRARTLRLVQKLDDHIGDGYGDERLERRIEQAIIAATPWQFSFILTGGWRRVGQHVTNARAADRADLLLLAVATHQLASLDGASDNAKLLAAAKIFGFGAEWVSKGLQTLAELRLVTSTDQPKCPHLRYAEVVIKRVLADRRDPFRQAILALLDAALADASITLEGAYWLLEPMRYADGLRGMHAKCLSAKTYQTLVARSFDAKASTDRNAAGFLLTRLEAFVPDWGTALLGHIQDIALWIRDADGISAWGLASFLNDIDRDHHEVVSAALGLVDAKATAEKMHSARAEELVGLGQLLDRLAVVGRDSFAAQLSPRVSSAKIRRQGKIAIGYQAYAFGKLVYAIHHYNPLLALQLVDDNAEALAATLAREPLDTFEALDYVIWFVLSFDLGLGISPSPSTRQRQLARRLCAQLNATDCARLVEGGRLRDLERWARMLSFLKRANIRLARKIVSEIQLDKLDAWLGPYWPEPETGIEHFVMMLAFPPKFEPARSWIGSHISDMREIPPRFAIIAPEEVAAAMRNGAELSYPESYGLLWERMSAAFAQLANTERQLAERAVRAQANRIARSLETHQANLYEGSDAFLSVIEAIAPGIERAIIEGINPELALKHWPEPLRGKAAQRRAIHRLLDGAAKASGDIKKVTAALRKRKLAQRSTTARRKC